MNWEIARGITRFIILQDHADWLKVLKGSTKYTAIRITQKKRFTDTFANCVLKLISSYKYRLFFVNNEQGTLLMDDSGLRFNLDVFFRHYSKISSKELVCLEHIYLGADCFTIKIYNKGVLIRSQTYTTSAYEEHQEELAAMSGGCLPIPEQLGEPHRCEKVPSIPKILEYYGWWTKDILDTPCWQMLETDRD